MAGATRSGAMGRVRSRLWRGVGVGAVLALAVHVVEVPTAGAYGAITGYQSDPKVTSVSVDQARHVATAASDPAYSDQWALPKIGWDNVHGVVNPSGTTMLAVLDTGVDA